jgi:hypothetical protein
MTRSLDAQAGQVNRPAHATTPVRTMEPVVARKPAKPASAWARYSEAVRRPLPALAVAMPMALLYELGSLVASTRHPGESLLAPMMLRAWFEPISIYGRMLPAVMLAASLIAWHLVRRDSTRLEPRTMGLMLLEGLGWAAVIFAFSWVWFEPAGRWGLPDLGLVRLALGAGVYEEMLFRLVGMTALHWLVSDLMGCSKTTSVWVAAGMSGLAFALYHQLGVQQIEWPYFVFHASAGVGLGWLFATRGFGITVVCHAAYNVVVAGYGSGLV